MIERLFDRLIHLLTELKYFYLRKRMQIRRNGSPGAPGQYLDVYRRPDFVLTNKSWGKGTAWTEIQYLLVNCSGRVLDIGCGACTTILMLSKFNSCKLYGCDISPSMIGEASRAGSSPSRLTICNAGKMPYRDGSFDYSYSIGSLEHFTEEGIMNVLRESHRITKNMSFHHVPVSRTGQDEGWIILTQAYYNNSIDWWLKKYEAVYPLVYVLDSRWEDAISIGKWFVCVKNRPLSSRCASL